MLRENFKMRMIDRATGFAPRSFAFVAQALRSKRGTQLCLACFLGCAALCARAQNAAAPTPTEPHRGQVIFSNTTDANGVTTTTVGPGAEESAAAQQNIAKGSSTAPAASDAERESVVFTDFTMDVHLRPRAHAIAVRALITVRNEGKTPLIRIPLQISSSLDWERIRAAGRDLPYTVATLNADTDHTGQIHEAAIAPATPLAPGTSLTLDVLYSGAIPQSAQRLVAFGTPNDVALHTDWDGIDTDFTGLRGFGNVLWYPAAAPPVLLGDGARVFDEIGAHKLRLSAAHFQLHLTIEFPHGHAPTVALVNGRSAPLEIVEPQNGGGDVDGVATATFASATLGFEAPSLFVATRDESHAANATFWTLPTDEASVAAWSSAIATVTPFLEGWLGKTPRSQLTILDLPDSQDAPCETGSLLVTAVRPGAESQLTGAMVHALAHAWMDSPRAWLSEGLAHFMDTLWIEKQLGREKALEALESGRAALALIEPSSPGQSAGQPLGQAIAPVYYRTKAAYVFWMLRDLAGDPALSAALRAYAPAADAARGFGPAAGSGTFEKLLENSAPNGDFSWFFADWVDADKGLPDLSIGHVFSTYAEHPERPAKPVSSQSAPAPAPEMNGWLVTVPLTNSGYAAAGIPVFVRNGLTSITQRVFVPARGTATEHILIQGRPTEVQANDGTIPETEASIHTKGIDAGSDSSSSPAAAPQ